MPRTVSVSNLRSNLPDYLDDLPENETLMVLRHNEPVAFILSPLRYKQIVETIGDVQDMLEAIKQYRQDGSKFSNAEDFFKELGL